VLEARCAAPTTPQRDVKRARIILLAAAGRSTRSIAQEVGVQPRIVSNWRRRFADHGLAGLEERPRSGKKPIYGQPTNTRILALLDKPPTKGDTRWTGPLLAAARERCGRAICLAFPARAEARPCRAEVLVRER
jgi:transposase